MAIPDTGSDERRNSDCFRSGDQNLPPLDTKMESPNRRSEYRLSTFERIFSTHAPIFESLLLQIPTDTILQLYHTSAYLRNFLQSYPTAWKYLSFRLLFPSGSQTRPLLMGNLDPSTPRQSRPYALDQLLMMVVVPLSPCLKSLELDNTAVSGQILISTVLHSRRETLEHLSVRGCKNVSLKYHIIPYLTMFGLQYDVELEKKAENLPSKQKLALKSLYTYRCRHHRRRPYLSSSLLRRDSDSEPTHELVILCHKLGIWTDTAWCTTPAGRCFRRRGYVSMRVPHGAPEVWVVFDRLWRSKNWLGSLSDHGTQDPKRDGRLWEHDELGFRGEPLGPGDRKVCGEGKYIPAHLRRSHMTFVENNKCDACLEDIAERCEQCSVLMHCVGCRRTLCPSCAYDRPYHKHTATPSPASNTSASQSLWWAPGAITSPCIMQDPSTQDSDADNAPNPTGPGQYPALRFHWCCTEPIFSGGGGISIGTTSRDVDLVRAAPLPRGQGWANPEFAANDWSKSFPKYAYGDPKKPDYTLETGHIEMMRWLLGPPTRQVSHCPRNLCQECYESPQWKVHCKSCSKPLCMEHDLRGLRLRICGYRDLALEKISLQSHQGPAGDKPNGSISVPVNNTLLRRPQTNTLADFDARLRQFHSRFPLLPSMNEESHSAASSVAGDQAGEDGAEMDPGVLRNFMERAGDSSGPDQQAVRSHSPTTSNLSRSSSRSSVYYDAATEMTRWQGCQSFFCPQYRPVGDQRQRCTSVLRECTSCSIHVCQDCVSKYPPCTCSYCEVNYLCPNCRKVREEDGTCRRVEEEKVRKEERWKKDMEMLEDILDRKLANEVAEFAGQFMDLIQEDNDGAGPSHLQLQDPFLHYHAHAQAPAQAPAQAIAVQTHTPMQPHPQTEEDIHRAELFTEHTNSDEEALLDEMMTPIAD